MSRVSQGTKNRKIGKMRIFRKWKAPCDKWWENVSHRKEKQDFARKMKAAVCMSSPSRLPPFVEIM